MQRRSYAPAAASVVRRIVVLTQDRPESLDRTLRSLDSLRVDNNTAVDVKIQVDGGGATTGRRQVVEISRRWRWPYGELLVHEHDRWLGISGQWYAAHVPADDDDYALIVEDDVELSPLALEWLNSAVRRFGGTASLAGYSLALAYGRLGSVAAPLLVHNGDLPFLYQSGAGLPWGFMPVPTIWRRFLRRWESGSISPAPLGGHRGIASLLASWAATSPAHSTWTAHFAALCVEESLYTLYAIDCH